MTIEKLWSAGSALRLVFGSLEVSYGIDERSRNTKANCQLLITPRLRGENSRSAICVYLRKSAAKGFLPASRSITADRAALTNTQASVATQTPISSVRKIDAAATESEIPVPSATYAAKHAGHFGNNARTIVGSEHFAQAKRRCPTRGGWALPSAAVCRLLAMLAVEQQVGPFICDPHSRSKRKLPSAPQRLLRDSGHDGGPTTS